LDAELVLQAWRIMARAPGNDHFRGGACHLHVLFPGRGNQGRTTDGRGFGLNRQERQAQQKRKFIGLEWQAALSATRTWIGGHPDRRINSRIRVSAAPPVRPALPVVPSVPAVPSAPHRRMNPPVSHSPSGMARISRNPCRL
jgi:hypothetical protein